MKFCTKCGNKMIDEAVVCVSCGCSATGVVNQAKPINPSDAPNTGFAVIGFFFPLIGLIMYLMMKDESPLKAKSAGKGAVVGVITSTVLSIISAVIYFVLFCAFVSIL